MSGSLTPTKITAWLDCAHFLALSDLEASGELDVSSVNAFGSMAQMLMDKGIAHEAQLLDDYRAHGLDVFDAGELKGDSYFNHWVENCAGVLEAGHDVVFQMPFVHDGMRGVADFLVRVDDPALGGVPQYEPVDAKLARREAKPGHILQLCFYADAIEALSGHRPRNIHVALGSGNRESVRLVEVDAYWRRLRSQLDDALAADSTAITTPEPCDHCEFCEYQPICEQQWRDEDSMVFVANLRSKDRGTLESAGVESLAGLSILDAEVDGLKGDTQERATHQAQLQVTSREAPDLPPAFEILGDTGPVVEGESLAGFSLLPEPNEGDVFLDFEGHPFWRPDSDLFFLYGLIYADDSHPSGWRYRGWWAHSKEEERQATKDLITYLVERHNEYPDMHIYHYNHTERSALERLCVEHNVSELDLDRLIRSGAFVDLYRVVLGAARIGTESYGLKYVEQLASYERHEGIDQGAGAVIEYETWMGDGDDEHLERIRVYNDDDVRATRAVRDWLVEQRPDGLEWRESMIDPQEKDQELDSRIERLLESEPGTPEHLMGDLLGYWRRERRAVSAQMMILALGDEAQQIEARGVIVDLKYVSSEPATRKNSDKPLGWTKVTLGFPEQLLDTDIKAGASLVEVADDGSWSYFGVKNIDLVRREIELKYPADRDKSDTPYALVLDGWVPERAKGVALAELADRLIAGDKGGAGYALLNRAEARFVDGAGPDDGQFSDDIDEICAWSSQLAESVVAIQGPPGTGKTYTGSHIARHLAKQGKRVGILAMSHRAIDNLVEAVVERYEDADDLDDLRLVRTGNTGQDDIEGVKYQRTNPKAAKGRYDILAGTAWFFASEAMQAKPVDVLIVDEAGQLGLADTVAASISAKSMILLGDPQQLPQVAQATHPGGSGSSALKYLIGEEAVISADQGVLLHTTRRMHPDVNEFISSVMYDSQLSSHESCAGQSTAAGTGLRWLTAVHEDCSTESPVEAELIATEIKKLMGQSWTDQHGNTRPLEPADFIVVAPYNHQRRCIGDLLESDSVTRGVPVGTVDKFQGREAAIVFFSMTSSSQEDMPRGLDFLFSKNRLNVAISRARCLAYLVSTEEILNARASDVAGMEMISAACAFVERATGA